MFVRRNRPRGSRLAGARLALFFLGAGIWMAGVLAGDDRVTFAAIALITLALVLRIVDRPSSPGSGTEDEPPA